MKLNKEDFIQVSGDLFEAVQSSKIFADSKTFVDSVPKKKPSEIKKEFQQLRKRKDFNLSEFIKENFTLPEEEKIILNLPPEREMEEHIELLWKYLERQAGKKRNDHSTLIPLPNSYIIPGGRFREIYYWDSFFTMQGLLACGMIKNVENMLNNFVYQIENLGHIPNGNRIYYLSRSQPPFFAAMVDSVSEYKKDKSWQLKYLDPIETEYNYWMKGENKKLKFGEASAKIVGVEDNRVLNRYFDIEYIPREESFTEDVTAASKLGKKGRSVLFNNIRAAAESGWDFSSRWFEDEISLSKCIASEIIPVDLNCLLYFYEKKISEMYSLKNMKSQSDKYLIKSIQRRDLINRIFWDKDRDFYFDYSLKTKKTTNTFSLAACYPLFFEIADFEKAASVSNIIEKEFLKPGGVITTLNHTGQQWDAPIGWAPLQYITILGLKNYGFKRLASEIKYRWLELNKSVFYRNKKMFEKYNVEDISLSAGGGEYPLQDGFGWTNGVAIALLKKDS
jgi:alpha,alpha-trehalase